jgi:hypothetical protein
MRPYLTLFVLALCLIANSGCTVPAPTGIVHGEVGWRVCPGPARPDYVCKPRALPGASVTFRAVGGGKSVVAMTGASGAYSITLPAGTYDVMLGGAREGLPYDGPKRVTVIAGATVKADFAYQNIAV